MRRFFLWLALTIGAVAPACAQLPGGVQQFGTVTAGNCTSWKQPGVIQDAGSTCGGGGGSGTVTSVGWVGGIVSVATPTTTPAFTIAGTSGGVPYFSSASTWTTSAALAANALVIGGGAGAAPSAITTGTGVVTALGIAVNGSGAISLTTSPNFITPVLGVATGTSLALSAGIFGTSNTLEISPVASANQATYIYIKKTDASNYERIAFTDDGNFLNIRAQSLGTGPAHELIIGRDSNLKVGVNAGGFFWTFNTDATFCTDPISTAGYCINNNTGDGNIVISDHSSTANTGSVTTNKFISTSAGTSSVPSVAIGGATNTGIYGSSTSFGVSVGGAVKLDYGITTASQFTITNKTTCANCEFVSTVVDGGFLANAAGLFYFNGRGGMKSSADGIILWVNNAETDFGRMQFGGTTSSFPAVKRNAAALNFRLADDSADAAITAGGANFSGAAIIMSALATDAATTDATVCVKSSDGTILKGSGTLGSCLGTSSARYKTDIRPLIAGLGEVLALPSKTFYLDKEHGDPGKQMYGFTAEDCAKVLPKLVGFDNEGRANTCDYLGIVPVLVHAVQEQQAQIEALKARLQ